MSKANPNNRGLSDKELAQQQMNAFNAMPSSWLTDEQVNALYMKELGNRSQHASVYWPGLGDRFLPDQIKELEWQVKSSANVLFIPINRNKNHWEFIVIARDSQSVCRAYRITTPGDGKCGSHTVRQSMQILDQGLASYANNNPGRVHELSPSDPIQAVLNAVNNSSASAANRAPESARSSSRVEHKFQPLRHQEETALSQQENRQFQTAVATSLKEIKHTSRFDYMLAQLAEYEHLGYGVESLITELTNMLFAMKPDQQDFAIKRLALSKLSDKPSITRIINGCKERVAITINNVQPVKLSGMRCILMPAKTPTPAPKPGNRMDDLDFQGAFIKTI